MAGFAPHIVVSGPVGAGKSTLATALADELGLRLELESAAEGNPFLADYYADPARWAFHSQAFFLCEAFDQQARAQRGSAGVVQDRHLHEHLAMFVEPKHEAGEMSDAEYALLCRLVDTAVHAVGRPDLLVYAYTDSLTLKSRITERGRDYEQHLTVSDLEEQGSRYERFVDNWALSPVLRVDTGEVDSRDPVQRAALADTVRRALTDTSSTRTIVL